MRDFGFKVCLILACILSSVSLTESSLPGFLRYPCLKSDNCGMMKKTFLSQRKENNSSIMEPSCYEFQENLKISNLNDNICWFSLKANVTSPYLDLKVRNCDDFGRDSCFREVRSSHHSIGNSAFLGDWEIGSYEMTLDGNSEPFCFDKFTNISSPDCYLECIAFPTSDNLCTGTPDFCEKFPCGLNTDEGTCSCKLATKVEKSYIRSMRNPTECFKLPSDFKFETKRDIFCELGSDFDLRRLIETSEAIRVEFSRKEAKLSSNSTRPFKFQVLSKFGSVLQVESGVMTKGEMIISLNKLALKRGQKALIHQFDEMGETSVRELNLTEIDKCSFLDCVACREAVENYECLDENGKTVLNMLIGILSLLILMISLYGIWFCYVGFTRGWVSIGLLGRVVGFFFFFWAILLGYTVLGLWKLLTMSRLVMADTEEKKSKIRSKIRSIDDRSRALTALFGASYVAVKAQGVMALKPISIELSESFLGEMEILSNNFEKTMWILIWLSLFIFIFSIIIYCVKVFVICRAWSRFKKVLRDGVRVRLAEDYFKEDQYSDSPSSHKFLDLEDLEDIPLSDKVELELSGLNSFADEVKKSKPRRFGKKLSTKDSGLILGIASLNLEKAKANYIDDMPSDSHMSVNKNLLLLYILISSLLIGFLLGKLSVQKKQKKQNKPISLKVKRSKPISISSRPSGILKVIPFLVLCLSMVGTSGEGCGTTNPIYSTFENCVREENEWKCETSLNILSFLPTPGSTVCYSLIDTTSGSLGAEIEVSFKEMKSEMILRTV